MAQSSNSDGTNELDSSVDGAVLKNKADDPGPGKKEWFKLLNQYAGMLALILSLIIGGLEVYERTVRKKADDLQDVRDRITNISQSFNSLRMESAFLSSNPTSIPALNRFPQINVERMILLDRLEALPKGATDEMSAVELALFGSEFTGVRRFETSVKYLEDAIERAGEDQIRLEAERNLALALFPPSAKQDVVRARQIMGSLSARLEGSSYPAALNELSVLKMGWVNGEISANECDAAKIRLDELISFWTRINQMPAFGGGSAAQIPAPDAGKIKSNYSMMSGCTF